MRLFATALACLLALTASLRAADGLAVFDSLAQATATKDGQVLEIAKGFEPTGVEITTNADGFAALVFSNGVAVYVSANTRLRVDRYDQMPFESRPDDFEFEPSRSDLKLTLIQGQIALTQRDPNPSSLLKVSLEDGVEASLKAQAAVLIHEGVEKEVAILKGRASIQIGDQTHLLNAGYRLQAHAVDPSNLIRPVTDALTQEWTPQTDIALITLRRWFFQTSDGAIEPMRVVPPVIRSSKPYHNTKL
ncbi:hypothetical protein [Cerasicoccus maritimus]|uniref:hypothetical protein n=1 Tax=Cerasicoccus maritimus TaxID=490089 RepID=UPI002852BDA8|nr:hypothetical protein [Cerasicoccus maritimus]